MILEKRVSCFLLGTGSVLGLFTCQAAIAQPIVPAADGTNTQVSIEGDQFDIDGGQLSGDGANLFHSFQEFGLDAEQTANFLSQPEIQNILGRVNGGNASFINGLLQVTGGNSNLYLINPSGILFGPDAQLNLPANFTAATATGVGFENGWFDLTTTAYSELTGIPELLGFDGAALGGLVNAGDLAVAEGQTLSLLGGTVVNTGEIEAPGGNIVVAAIASPEDGSAIVRLSPVDGILSLDVQAEALVAAGTPEALSLPQLITGGGLVESATGLTVNETGVAVLSGSGVQIADEAGTAIVSGQLAVAGNIGGDVQVTGDRVGLVAANIDASGINGGGTALIGGYFQGQGVLPTAQQTYVSGDAAIDVSSAEAGNAGTAIVWADDATQFYGTVDAQGGQTSGDGGFVEISGANQLAFDGDVLLDAPNGTSGSLLLDPQIIQIVAGAGGANDAEVTGDNAIFAADGGGATFTISEQALESLSGSVTLEATEIIAIDNLSDNVLSFQAASGDTVTFRALTPVSSGGNLQFDSLEPTTIETNGGNIVIDVDQFTGEELIGQEITSPSIISDGGDITITSATTITTIQLIDSSSSTGSAGDVTLEADIQVGSAGNARIDEVNASSTSTTPGNADGGNITVSTDPDIGQALFIEEVNTSSVSGNAGDIEYFSGGSIRGGALTLSFDASTQSTDPQAQAGNITLTALGQEVGNISVIEDLEVIRATSNSGLGGNLTLRADEIDFQRNGTDPDPSLSGIDFGDPPPLDIEGQVRFEPISSGQDILVGGSGFLGDPGPDTLHISAFELNTFSDRRNSEGGFNRAGGGVFVATDGDGTIEFASTLQEQPLFIDVTIEGGDQSVIIGPDQATDYIILGTGSGIIGGFGSDIDDDGIQDTSLRFTNVGTIQAGAEDDALVFLNDDATFEGSFDGGGGNNVLDFSGTPVASTVFPDGVSNTNVDGYTQDLSVDLTADPAVTLVSDPSFVIVEGQVANITGVVGGSGNDIILGDDNNNQLGGGPGNDIIDGLGGNDFIDIERDASFELLVGTTADNELRIDTGNDGTFEETDQISNVEVARLIGGDGNNTFTIGADSWQGPLVLLDGGDGNDTYNIGIDGVGTGSIIVGDTGATGTDTLTVVGSDSDDVFALEVAASPNPGGFDPNPLSGLSLPEDSALLARLDEDVTAFSTDELSLLDTIDILDTLDELNPDPAPLPGGPAYKVSRVSLAAETAAFSGIENLGFDGAEGSDAYTPTLGATSAENLLNITINDSGTTGQDSLTVSGNEFSNNFEITLATDVTSDSVLTFETPNFAIGPEIINFSGLEEVALDGAADTAPSSTGDTFTLSLGSPSSITLDIADSGAADEGIDTLIINGTAAADTFEVGSSSINLLETGEQVPYSGIDALSLEAGAGVDTITVTEAVQFGFGLDIDAGTDGGNIAVNADIAVGSDLATLLATEVAPGITLATINGAIDTSGGALSTTTTTVASGAVTLSATGDIATGNITTTSTTEPSGGVVIETPGNIDTSGGAIDASSANSTSGGVTLTAGSSVTTSAITASGTGIETDDGVPSGVIAITAETGNISTTGAALTTASSNGRGAPIDLQAVGSIATGDLVTTGQTGGGAVTLEGTTVQANSVNTQGTIVAGGDIEITTSQLQVPGTFVDNNGIVASISAVGATEGGTITLTFPEETTFTVGDSTLNGTTGAITSDSAILPITVIEEDFQLGSIQIGIPTIPDFVLAQDFQTLIEDPTQQAPLPLICLLSSNLRSEAGIELLPDLQEGNPFCPQKHKASAE